VERSDHADCRHTWARGKEGNKGQGIYHSKLRARRPTLQETLEKSKVHGNEGGGRGTLHSRIGVGIRASEEGGTIRLVLRVVKVQFSQFGEKTTGGGGGGNKKLEGPYRSAFCSRNKSQPEVELSGVALRKNIEG